MENLVNALPNSPLQQVPIVGSRAEPAMTTAKGVEPAVENSSGHVDNSSNSSDVTNENSNHDLKGNSLTRYCDVEAGSQPQWDEEHWHYSHRSPWLRAMVLGANDGLVSIASLMLGVSAVKTDPKAMVISGLAGLVAGAGSMAIGEFVSVFSQRDSELADIEKERQEHAKGPEAEARELEELAQIYVTRGLPYYLARQVAVELSKVDAVKAHARDELGIDVEALSNPFQAATASGLAFSLGGAVPLIAGGFVNDYKLRIAAVIGAASLALAAFGALGAKLGGASKTKASLRVLIGGWLAMGLTYGILRLLRVFGF